MKSLAKIILKSGKERSVKRLHPWIFSGAIKSIHGELIEGEIVEVYSNKDEYLATGYYQPGSIAVKILTFSGEEINEKFWKERIEKAWRLRLKSGLTDNEETNAFRLVCGEGDSLPGLIIDYYNGTAVMQSHSAGMYHQRYIIAEVLKNILGDRLTCIYDKSETSLPSRLRLNSCGEYLFGRPATNLIRESGNTFQIDWEAGQKTGFFLDQRDNRKLLACYSRNRKVLNMFSYSGGFSVYALRGGADLVHSVDSSKAAIDLAEINVELNFTNEIRHRSFVADAFEFFTRPESDYDLIIIDPPAFAKHQDALDNALQGYKKLNRKAIEMINPGGIIFTFSCSQAVSRENFRKCVFSAAANTHRNVRILHQLSQPADHPVSIYHPEGEYLKGLVLAVD